MKKLLLLPFLLAPTLANATFADVDVTHPHFQAVQHFEAQDILQGYAQDGKRFFRGSQYVTRAEAVKVLLLAAGFENFDAGNPFPDVGENAWFRPFVAAAAEAGIVRGFADGQFHPEAQVTQAELLKMVLEALNAPVEEPGSQQTWYHPYEAKAIEWRLIESDPTPHKSVSRGELVELIFRAQRVAEKGFSEPYVFHGRGTASWYGDRFAGRQTANGEIYDPMDLTAAHRTLPFDTRLKVTHDGKSVIVRINDRGPYSGTRVLDLSEAAFAKLAPIERGVIEVEMEQFSGAKEALPTLPEFVRDVVSPVIKNPTLPEEVAEKVQETRGEQTPEPSLRQPLFDETVAHLSEDFFERIELRHPVPQKVIAGTVLNISGTIDAYGHETVTVFLDAGGGETREQLHFSDELSGKNFVVPVQFLEPGTYRLGIVIDDNRRSRVGEIEVVRPTRERRFPSSDHDFSQAKFQTRVIPEKQKVALDFFLLKPGNLVKVIFAQGNRREALLIEGGLQTIELPYEFFQQFSDGGPFEVEVYFADSETGKLADRRTNWQLFESRTYQLVPGFRDTESEKISVQNFPRYPKSLEEFLLSGKVLEKDVTLKDTVFWHTPTGNIRKIPLVKGPTPDQFSFRLIPEGWGTHVLEIVSDEGEILFNRALYFAETYVLPVQAWQYESLNGNNSVALRDWVNRLRRNRGVSILTTDTKLQAVAQQYAEQMAAEDFVSHTSPTGLTFQDRIENAHLQGDFAENLSFGSTLEVALQGLEESASHFQHIIGRKWNSIGIGLAQNDKGWYVVQVFGR